jgi:hypothetical protein
MSLAAGAATITAHSQLLNMISGLPKYSLSMWTYLWDIVDEGYDSVFKNLTESGINSVSLATAYHAGKFLEPHNPRRKVVFPEDGTVYFKPNKGAYGKLRPRVNTLVKSGHGLESVKRAADKFGLTTRAWIVCCHNTPLGIAHPEVTSEDVFGDRLFHNLCPSNEDVRSYLRTLVADVASHQIDTIELEALQFQGYAHGFHHEREGIELTPTAKMLLGFCFCPSCLSRARSVGYSLEALRAFAGEQLNLYFKDPAKGMMALSGKDSIPTQLLEPFLAWRESVVSSLLSDLMSVSGPTKLRQLVNIDPLARRMVSVDVSASAKMTGGVLALGYVRDGNSLREPLKALRSLVGSGELTLGLQLGLPESGGKKEFLEKMSVAIDQGVVSFNFYNYGFVPLQNLGWIKEAVTS